MRIVPLNSDSPSTSATRVLANFHLERHRPVEAAVAEGRADVAHVVRVDDVDDGRDEAVLALFSGGWLNSVSC